MDFLHQLDHTIFQLINQQLANSVFDFLCPIIRNKTTWIPLYLILAYKFYKAYPKQVVWILIGALLSILLTDQISSSLIKPLIHRLRPCNNPAVSARLILDHCGGGFSFVSSHAANHFGLAVFFLFFMRNIKAKFFYLFWAAAISFSQVYVGVHYPADVLGGAMLGIVVGGGLGVIIQQKVSINVTNS
jgi:undecaprenyl-diphosphatase